ncbi:MAG: hypothetical protein MMC23_009342 [Stictis urceolatum]|nr:hypothetical protein [Stictis urceolata]
MADPLSIAASTAGLLTITHAILTETMKFVGQAKDTDSSIARFKIEVVDLFDVLTTIREVAQDLDKQQPQTTRPICRGLATCESKLNSIALALKLTPDYRSNSRRQALLQMLQWPSKAARVERSIGEIERCKQTLSLCMLSYSMSIVSKIKVNQAVTGAMVKQEI